MERLGQLLKGSVSDVFRICVRHNSNRTGICQIKRSHFLRTYPTMVVLPNGGTITIRYKEPRSIIKLPLDLATLSPEERAIRLQKRFPRKKREFVADIGDDFNVNKYKHLWKKK